MYRKCSDIFLNVGFVFCTYLQIFKILIDIVVILCKIYVDGYYCNHDSVDAFSWFVMNGININ